MIFLPIMDLILILLRKHIVNKNQIKKIFEDNLKI